MDELSQHTEHEQPMMMMTSKQAIHGMADWLAVLVYVCQSDGENSELRVENGKRGCKSEKSTKYGDDSVIFSEINLRVYFKLMEVLNLSMKNKFTSGLK